MTYTSEEMIKAANEAIWNSPALTENEQAIARDFFYKGALWAASKMESNDLSYPCCMKCGNPLLTDELVCKDCGKQEEARSCEMDYFRNGRKCGNCGHLVGQYFKYCIYCGYKFIKGE